MKANNIRTLRRRLGLSQNELASLLGIHFMTVSRWERAVLLPDAWHAALLEHIDRIDCRELSVVLASHGPIVALCTALGATSQ